MSESYTVNIASETTGDRPEPLKKGSYKLVCTNVKWSGISEWPDWKVQSAVDRHNERENERAKHAAAEGKTYETHIVDGPSGLSVKESAEYVWFFSVKGGRHDGYKCRPYYTGISLHPKKEYRTKSNLYKVLDALLPDVEAVIASGSLDVRDAIGYPLMAQLDLTDKGNQKYTAFMQSDEHGQRDTAVALGAEEVTISDDDAPIPF